MEGYIECDRRVTLSRNQGRSDSAIGFYPSPLRADVSAQTGREPAEDVLVLSKGHRIRRPERAHRACKACGTNPLPVNTLVATLG